MRKNWEKAMYAQNDVNAKRSFPTSWRCSAVITVSSSGARCMAGASTERSAMNPTNAPEKKYTPNIVEYQCGVSDMIQSMDANVWVIASTMIDGPARR